MTEIIFGLWIGLVVAVLACGLMDANWKQDTVHRGLAIYCQNNGKWAWNGECDE